MSIEATQQQKYHTSHLCCHKSSKSCKLNDLSSVLTRAKRRRRRTTNDCQAHPNQPQSSISIFVVTALPLLSMHYFKRVCAGADGITNGKDALSRLLEQSLLFPSELLGSLTPTWLCLLRMHICIAPLTNRAHPSVPALSR